MPRLIMLAGPSGSGKTTLRPDLHALLDDPVILSRGDLLESRALVADISYADAWHRWRDAAMAEVMHALDDAATRGRDIIWDQTNLTAALRQARLTQIPDSYTTIAVACEAPLGVLIDRVRGRRGKIDTPVPPGVITDQADRYARPHFDEGFDHVFVVRAPGRQLLRVA